MEKGIKIGGIVLFTAFILAIIIPDAIATHVSCGANITSSTSLDSDLSCSSLFSGFNGITMGVNNIILNCNNHFISGGRSIRSGTYGIRAINRKNITIYSCKVSDFDRGISFSSTTQNTLQYNNISRNNLGITLSSSNSNTILYNSIENNLIGFDISLSNNNLIFNNIFKNSLNASDNGKNFWDFNGRGLLGSWYFFEGIGKLINDGSGNKHTGFLFNGLSWVNGIRGNALEFDGIDAYPRNLALTSPGASLQQRLDTYVFYSLGISHDRAISTSTLSWTNDVPEAPMPGSRYDVIRGDIANLISARGLGGVTTTPVLCETVFTSVSGGPALTENPAIGSAYFFVTRPENSIESGNYGGNSTGVARANPASGDCPL